MAFPPQKLEKCYDDFVELSKKIQDNEIVKCISEIPLGFVPACKKVIEICNTSVSEYQEAKEERIRIQQECDEHIKILTDYRAEIEKHVSGYLVANITVFDEAFDQMDMAVLNNDSDAYIGANSSIQKQLGKDMQFHSQDEFDGLMDSDDNFKL